MLDKREEELAQFTRELRAKIRSPLEELSRSQQRPGAPQRAVRVWPLFLFVAALALIRAIVEFLPRHS